MKLTFFLWERPVCVRRTGRHLAATASWLEATPARATLQQLKNGAGIEEKIGEALEERLGTLEIHGGAILYYQDSQADELGGENADRPSGAGFTADLDLTWKPALPVVEDGEFYF